MEKTKKNNFRLVGLKLENKTTNENNQASTDCGNLWQKFERERIFELIPNKLTNEVFAVYFDYEKDETKPFSYFIGCKVDKDTEAPQGLKELQLPAQNYFKVTAKGVMTGCITEAWQKIWNSDIKRRFAFDFEVYDERSKDWKDAELDIYISTAE
jgi:predicted transcriptional regulator YdeE